MTPRDRLRAALPLVLATAGLLGACDAGPATVGSGAAVPPALLADSTWTIVSAQGRPIPGGDDLLWFHDAFLIGSTGCNRFTAKVLYDAPSGVVQVRPPTVTGLPCRGPLAVFEQSFLQSLAGARTASLDPAGRLVLDGLGGPLILAPTDQPPPTA